MASSHLILLFLLIFTSSVYSVTSYKSCLECFYQNRTEHIFCLENSQCLPWNTLDCSFDGILSTYNECLEGYNDCVNVTFTENSFGNEN